MSPALTDLNIVCLQQLQRIKAIDTRAPQYHQPRPAPLRAHDVERRARPTGRCQVLGCGRVVRGNRAVCAECRADAAARAHDAWKERGWA